MINWGYLGILPTSAASGGGGGTESAAAIITPNSAHGTVGKTTSLHVTGINTRTYQWQVAYLVAGELKPIEAYGVSPDQIDDYTLEWHDIDGTIKSALALEGDTSDTLRITPDAGVVMQTGTHWYRCKCTGLLGTVYTQMVPVTISAQNPVITFTANKISLAPPGKVIIRADIKEALGAAWSWKRRFNEGEWEDVASSSMSYTLVEQYNYGCTNGLAEYKISGTREYDLSVTPSTTPPNTVAFESQVVPVIIGHTAPVVEVSASASEVYPAGNVTLTAIVTDADVGVQWQELVDGDWEDIESGTTSEITISYAYGDARGKRYYRCLVTGYGGTSASTTIIIDVAYNAPVISVTPAQGVDVITLSAVSMYADTGIVWQKIVNETWETIAGATGSTYNVSLTSGLPAGTHIYRAVATGYGGTTASDSVFVTISYERPTASITSDIARVTAPGNIVFSVLANYAHLGVQWQERISGTWTNISGETGEHYTAAYTTENRGEHKYRCIAKGYGGETASNELSITVV